MLTAVGQYVGGKVITAILTAGVIGAGIWFWRHPEQLQTIWTTIKYVLAWMGFVLVLPWATFFVTAWVVKKESNAIAWMMLGGYLLADMAVAFWMVGTVKGLSALSWVVLILGFLSAAVYNFKACEHQAERAEGGL